MATIFYSMAGEGRGHATRVRAVAQHLRARHDVVLFCPGAAHAFLAPLFADDPRVTVEPLPGLFFRYDSRDRVHALRTAGSALRYACALPRLVDRLAARVERERPALVISDFEPALPRAARRVGVPVVSLSHQAFLLACDLRQLPRGLRVHAALMGLVVRAFQARPTATIVSSFYAAPLKPGYAHAHQTGVLLRPAIRASRPRRGAHLVCYLRRALPINVARALQATGRPVRIYGLGERPPEGRLEFRAIDEEGFVADLASAEALISTAGNQLVGEALFLGKPVFAIPEDNNREQSINAWFLRASGAGDWSSAAKLRASDLTAFLARLEDHRRALQSLSVDGTPRTLRLIDACIDDATRSAPSTPHHACASSATSAPFTATGASETTARAS